MAAYEVRLKDNGRIFSRHYHANDPKKAAQKANKLNKGRIISVRKVKPADIIGTVESMGLDDIIGVEPKRYMGGNSPVFENTTLEDVVFFGKGSKRKREKRRAYDKVKIKREE